MKILFQFSLLVIITSVIICKKTYSQDISNVHFEVVNDQIKIYYNLTANPDDKFDVSVILKRQNDKSFNYEPENLSGDVGSEKIPGNNKTIFWNVSEEEMNMFDGDDFYFEVYAEKVEPSGGIPWYYYVGTAAVGGAAAVLLLGKGSDNKSSSSTTNFPTPPERP